MLAPPLAHPQRRTHNPHHPHPQSSHQHQQHLQPPSTSTLQPPTGSALGLMDHRPESYFESQQDATDIYDLYDFGGGGGAGTSSTRDSAISSVYGTESVYSVGRESMYEDGGGVTAAPAANSGASPLHFPAKLGGLDEAAEDVVVDAVPGQQLASPDPLRRPSDGTWYDAEEHLPPTMSGDGFDFSRRPSYPEDGDGVGGGGGVGGGRGGAGGGSGGWGAGEAAPNNNNTSSSTNNRWVPAYTTAIVNPTNYSGPAVLGAAPLSVVTGVPSPLSTTLSISTSSPTTPRGTASAIPSHVRATTPLDRSRTPDNALSPTGSDNTPNTTSPVHASIRRIHSQQRVVSTLTESSGVSSSVASLVGGGGIVGSQASLVSTQYPGEEADAFHVRSTYARLEFEGVHGDGWDEGVERTRGGANNNPERKTVMLPTRGALTEQELKFLKSLDRYGFVDQPTRSRSEGRLALVPAAPLKKVPKLKTGNPPQFKPKPAPANPPRPPSPKQPPENTHNAAERRQRSKETERVMKWMNMMSVAQRDEGANITGWKWSAHGDGAKHPTRIYKGIPDRWRMAAWWTLVEGRSAQAGRQRSHESLEAEYVARKEAPSTSDVQIDLDVPRTISGHALFRTRFGLGQRALFHVLHVFSQSCGTCAYCQGMGSLVATLLCYFEPERAYTLMVRMHDLYDMHGIFAPGFPGLLETLYVQERLMEMVMPDVYESFQRNMISSTAWGTKIYITLFVNTVPFNVQLRIWDAFFLDGYDVMIVAVLALLWAFRPTLTAPGADFEVILSLLSSYFVPEDDDVWMSWIRRFLWEPGVKERMRAWRMEWRGLVERGQTDGRLI